MTYQPTGMFDTLFADDERKKPSQQQPPKPTGVLDTLLKDAPKGDQERVGGFFTPAGLDEWAERHPDQAQALARQNTPSRRDLEASGIRHRMTAEQRAEVAAGIREGYSKRMRDRDQAERGEAIERGVRFEDFGFDVDRPHAEIGAPGEVPPRPSAVPLEEQRLQEQANRIITESGVGGGLVVGAVSSRLVKPFVALERLLNPSGEMGQLRREMIRQRNEGVSSELWTGKTAAGAVGIADFVAAAHIGGAKLGITNPALLFGSIDGVTQGMDMLAGARDDVEIADVLTSAAFGHILRHGVRKEWVSEALRMKGGGTWKQALRQLIPPAIRGTEAATFNTAVAMGHALHEGDTELMSEIAWQFPEQALWNTLLYTALSAPQIGKAVYQGRLESLARAAGATPEDATIFSRVESQNLGKDQSALRDAWDALRRKGKVSPERLSKVMTEMARWEEKRHESQMQERRSTAAVAERARRDPAARAELIRERGGVPADTPRPDTRRQPTELRRPEPTAPGAERAKGSQAFVVDAKGSRVEQEPPAAVEPRRPSAEPLVPAARRAPPPEQAPPPAVRQTVAPVVAPKPPAKAEPKAEPVRTIPEAKQKQGAFADLLRTLPREDVDRLLSEHGLALRDDDSIGWDDRRDAGQKIRASKREFVDWLIGKDADDDPAKFGTEDAGWMDLVRRAREIATDPRSVAEPAPVLSKGVKDEPKAEVKAPAEPAKEAARPTVAYKFSTEEISNLKKSGVSDEDIASMQPADVWRMADGADPKTGNQITVTAFRGSGRTDKRSVYADGVEGPVLGDALYYGINKEAAERFGPNVEQVEVTLKNPAVITNSKQMDEWIGGATPRTNEKRIALFAEVRRKMEAAGHDGVIVNSPRGTDMDASGESAKRLREVFGQSQVIVFQKPAPAPPAKAEPKPEAPRAGTITQEEYDAKMADFNRDMDRRREMASPSAMVKRRSGVERSMRDKTFVAAESLSMVNEVLRDLGKPEIKLPEGYVRDGDRYVFKPAPVLSKGVKPKPAAREPWEMTRAEVMAIEGDALAKTLDEKLANAQELLGIRERGNAPAKQSIVAHKKLRVKAIEREIAEKESEHRAAVEAAHAAGKPIPAAVLAEYPELKAEKPAKIKGPKATTEAPPAPPPDTAPIDSFLEGRTPMDAGRLRKTLTKPVFRVSHESGKEYRGPAVKVLDEMLADGYVPKSAEVKAVQDVSRTRYNRMDQREQDAHAKRQREAGMKTEYRLEGKDDAYFVVTKAEHDYAQARMAAKARPAARPEAVPTIYGDLSAKEAATLDSKKYQNWEHQVGNDPEGLARTAEAREIRDPTDVLGVRMVSTRAQESLRQPKTPQELMKEAGERGETMSEAEANQMSRGIDAHNEKWEASIERIESAIDRMTPAEAAPAPAAPAPDRGHAIRKAIFDAHPFKGVDTATKEAGFISSVKKALKPLGVEAWKVDSAVESLQKEKAKHSGGIIRYISDVDLFQEMRKAGDIPAPPVAAKESPAPAPPKPPSVAEKAPAKPVTVADIDKAANREARDDLLVEKGAYHTPGLRLGDMETAGVLAYAVEKGDATLDDWNAWVERAKAENRFSDKDAPVRPPDGASKGAKRVMADPVDQVPEEQRFTSTTPQENVKVQGRWRVIDVNDLVTSDRPGYDQDLQLRNRTTDASRAQIERIAAAPDADRLRDSPETSAGAPFIDSDGQVVSGNGRTIGLRKAYEEYKSADAYRASVLDAAKRMNLDAEGIARPVLVREIMDSGGATLEKVAELSNRPSTLQMSESEKAYAEGRIVGQSDIMDMFKPSDSGDLLAASNRDFMVAFVRAVGDESLLDSKGNPGAEAVKRVRQAVLGSIFDVSDSARDLVRLAIEQRQVLHIERELNGIMTAGGGILNLARRNPPYDIRQQLTSAFERYVDYRQQREAGKARDIDEYIAQARTDMFREFGDFDELLIRSFDDAKSVNAIRDFFNEYVRIASKIDAGDQAALFDMAVDMAATPLQVAERARDAAKGIDPRQQNLFGEDAGVRQKQPRPGDADRGTSDAQRPPATAREEGPVAEPAAEPDAPRVKGSGAVGFPGVPDRDLFGPQREGLTRPDRKIVQPADIVSAIRREWPELTVRGKATFRKNALGWYHPDEKTMRSKDIRGLTTYVHELGHHFDYELGRWSMSKGKADGINAELLQMGKDLYGKTKPKGGYKGEGFAEFIREYLTGGDVEGRAPNTYKWFLTEYLAKNPVEAAKLKRIEGLFVELELRSIEDSLRAFRQPLKRDYSPKVLGKNLMRAFDDKIRDSIKAIEHAFTDAGLDHTAMRASKDPVRLAQAFQMTAPGKVLHAALEECTDIYGANRTGESLREALAPASIHGQERLEEAVDYMVAQRALLYQERGLKSGLDPKVAQAFVDKHRSPELDDVTRRVTEWAHNRLYLLVESGFWTQAEFDKVVENNPVYIPFSRQFLHGEKRTGTGPGGKGTGVYRVKGGTSEINNPLLALLRGAERIQHVAQNHMIKDAFFRAALDAKQTKTGYAGKLASPVPQPTTSVEFNAEQIEKQLQGMGVDTEGADLDKLITVYQKGVRAPSGSYIIPHRMDGKLKFFEVSPEIYNLFENLHQGALIPGLTGRLMRKSTRMLRAGALGLNPVWGARNVQRDILDSIFGFEYAKYGPLSAIGGHARAVGYKLGVKDEDAKRHWAMGVPLATFIGQSGKDVRPLVRKVGAVTKTQKMIAAAHDPLGTVESIVGFSEHGTRLAESAAAWKQSKEQGMDDADAAITATIAGKDATTDYTRGGEWTTLINQAYVFFRARVNYLDRVARKTRKHPFKTLLKGIGWLTMPAFLTYLANRNEEWWQDLPPWEKWGYLHVPVPWSKQPQRIPLPFLMGRVFGSLPIAAIEDFRNPGAFADALRELKANETPELFPTIVEGAKQVWRNKDWMGRPIIPQRVAGRLPEDQYTDTTSPVAVAIGQLLGVSPAQIEHIADFHTGGLFRRLSRAIETIDDPSLVSADPATWPMMSGLFLREGRTRFVADHYERQEALDRQRKSGKVTPEELGELVTRNRMSRELNDLWRERRQIQENVKPMSEAKPRMDAISRQIDEKIRELEQLGEEDFRKAGAGFAAYSASGPSASSEQIAEARRVFRGMSIDERRAALRKDARRRGMSTQVWGANRQLTPFGERLRRLERLMDSE